MSTCLAGLALDTLALDAVSQVRVTNLGVATWEGTHGSGREVKKKGGGCERERMQGGTRAEQQGGGKPRTIKEKLLRTALPEVEKVAVISERELAGPLGFSQRRVTLRPLAPSNAVTTLGG